MFFILVIKEKFPFFNLKKNVFFFLSIHITFFLIHFLWDLWDINKQNWLDILIPIGFKFYIKWNSTYILIYIYIYIYLFFEVKFIPICECLNPMTGMHSFFIIIFSFCLSYFSLTSKNLIKTSHILFNSIHSILLLYSFILFYNNWFRF